ncbi:dCTP deaminase domain-containing protein [Nonomuraea sp. NPDC050556]|uniref:dCTP deaminase n=1 Tax=Nonomuraea sp. NPDC050556 TaxID=3364369 RepID=UPI0037BD19C4
MILTGPAIAQAVRQGDIVIDPFQPERLSPNAYDWRLGDTIRVCGHDLDAAVASTLPEQPIPPEGMTLQPGLLYLGVTHERTHSERYAQLLNGDHTIGGLGVWVHISAPLGHVGHAIRWTLEICVVRPVRIYPHMTFGKLVFLETYGSRASYQQMGSKYMSTEGIDVSRLHEELN